MSGEKEDEPKRSKEIRSDGVQKKWTFSVRRWKEAISYFGIAYEDRISKGVED